MSSSTSSSDNQPKNSDGHYSNDFYSDESNSKRIIEMSQDENTHPSYYLRLRDLEGLVKQFKPADKRIEELQGLDYGCGAGRPMRHFKKMGMKNIIGCDINESLLKLAKQLDPAGEYVKLELPENPEDADEKLLPFENNRFDFLFSCMVIIEIGRKQALQNMFNETSRVLRPGGLYFLIKSPKEVYAVETGCKFKFFNIDYPENVNITSGSRIKFGYMGMEFNEYFWEEHDLVEMCARAGLEHVHTHGGLGQDERDGVEWLDEKKVPVYLVMIFKKQ